MKLRPTASSVIALLTLLAACGDGAPPAAAPEPLAAPAVPEAQATVEPSPAEAPPAAGSRPVAVPFEVPAEIKELLAASDRSEADRKLDEGRHPGEMLAFFEIKPGMAVAELGAGTGYTAELLARRVGPKGKVYGQNSKFILERFAEAPWSARLKKPLMRTVVRADREFDDPLPPEAKNLDAAFLVLFYHDTFWMGIDRAKMNKAVFNALKPGGVFAVIDHSAAGGHGGDDVKTLHRVEESLLKTEVQAAGFELSGEAQFLRNPDDALDWSASPSTSKGRRGTSDRFVLKFKKPAG